MSRGLRRACASALAVLLAAPSGAMPARPRANKPGVVAATRAVRSSRGRLGGVDRRKVDRARPASRRAARPASALEQLKAGPFDPAVRDGVAFVQYSYDVGLSVDLEAAERRVKDEAQRSPLLRQRRVPQHLRSQPAPLRVTQRAEERVVGEWRTLPSVDALLYEFGAVTVTYRLLLSGPFSSLAKLSELLDENQELLADSRRMVGELLERIKPAVGRPRLSSLHQSHSVFQVREFAEPGDRERLLEESPALVAQVLRADTELSSEQEVRDAVSSPVSYAGDDVALVDRTASVIVDQGGEDTRAVIDYANVQLLEQRLLDGELDSALDRYYEALAKSPRVTKRALAEVGQLQVESALLFEGVNNGTKLFGDQYLAKLYQQAARRLDLAAWDSSVQRKLGVLDGVYEKMENVVSRRHSTFLEWIIIGLIAFEIVMPVLKRVAEPLLARFF